MASDELVNVRYLVADVAVAVDFYSTHFGFRVLTSRIPAFADVARGNLRLLLSGPESSAGRPMSDGERPGPGGWNRIHFVVDDLDGEISRLTANGVALRNEVVTGPGGSQVLVCDPSGNFIELFQPASPRKIAATTDAVRWKALEQAEPEFAARVRRLFDAGRHKTIATLRADGSPRISGIECEFADGDLRFGSMAGARKGADLKRDPRFALHGPTVHPEEGKEREWPGEAKIAGRAVVAGPVGEGGPEGETFVADITEVVVTRLNPEATKLLVEFWTPEGGLRSVERD